MDTVNHEDGAVAEEFAEQPTVRVVNITMREMAAIANARLAEWEAELEQEAVLS